MTDSADTADRDATGPGAPDPANAESPEAAGEVTAPGEFPELYEVLLGREEAEAIEVRGSVDSAVLVPVRDWPERPVLIFTERRADMKNHAGEISFPGGRRDPADPDLSSTALREAEEEIRLPPGSVELAGALTPVATYVTSFRIQPYVGLVAAGADLRPDPAEVAAILSFRVEELSEGYAMRRLVRHGVPFRTPTFEVGRHLIWGATARILADLMTRLDALR